MHQNPCRVYSQTRVGWPSWWSWCWTLDSHLHQLGQCFHCKESNFLQLEGIIHLCPKLSTDEIMAWCQLRCLTEWLKRKDVVKGKKSVVKQEKRKKERKASSEESDGLSEGKKSKLKLKLKLKSKSKKNSTITLTCKLKNFVNVALFGLLLWLFLGWVILVQ